VGVRVNAAVWDSVVPAISPKLRVRIACQLRRLHVRGEVEDLVQDTFLRVLLAEVGGRIAPRDLGCYLGRVADRVATDYARRLRTQKRSGGAFHHQLCGGEAIPDPRPWLDELAMLAFDA
jgi:DNA-directed RNA polymerase specialized sigma24 family protein